MELPEGLYLREVPDAPDLVAFTFPFELEGKALDGFTAETVEELEDGDLIIEGFAVDFEGVDRQGENFLPGAFERGAKSFLNGSAALCYHHHHDQVLGKVLALEERETPERSGLWLKARVDGAIKDHPTLKTIYNQIKRGTLRGLSVGGFFKRMRTAAGNRISDLDFVDISVTGVPVHARPSFAVVAGKALDGFGGKVGPDDNGALADLSAALDRTIEAFEGKALPESHDPAAASYLASVLRGVGTLRQAATEIGRVNELHPDVQSLVETIETSTAQWESNAHNLAATVGPLPVEVF